MSTIDLQVLLTTLEYAIKVFFFREFNIKDETFYRVITCKVSYLKHFLVDDLQPIETFNPKPQKIKILSKH